MLEMINVSSSVNMFRLADKFLNVDCRKDLYSDVNDGRFYCWKNVESVSICEDKVSKYYGVRYGFTFGLCDFGVIGS